MTHDYPAGRHYRRTRLWWAFGINLIFLVVEVLGGLFTHSLALLSDAGHMLTDVMALGLAILVSRLAERPPDARRTYGYMRLEVIGAFVNGGTLVFICIFILYEAIRRVNHVPEILGGPMLVVALLGLVANLGSAWVLAPQQENDLNIKGAYLHLIYDALGSVGAVVAGVVILIWNWTPVDILTSIFIVLLILAGTGSLLKQSVNLLLDAVPDHINYGEVRQALMNMGHVCGVHDLHVWSISQDEPALSAHLQVTDECRESHHWHQCLEATRNMLETRFNIHHTTLQMEPASFMTEKHCD